MDSNRRWWALVETTLNKLKIKVLLSRFAHARYLGDRRKVTLTETVKAWKEYRPHYVPLPHPSPRNNIWLKKNPWFAEQVLPDLRRRVEQALR